MDILKDKNNQDLLRSLIAEVAKASNELKCAQADLAKAQNRISFTLMLINELKDRDL